MSRGPKTYLAFACVILIVTCAVAAGCGNGATGTSTTGANQELDRFGYPVNAHVQPQLGVVPAGIELDARVGTPPEPVGETDLQAAADAAGCDLMLDLPDEGNQHLDDPNVPTVHYGTNPPTSGDHYGNPSETLSGALADGAYREYPEVGRVVHSMEHGRVEIEYSPDLSEPDQLALKGIFDAAPAGVILFPNPDMPYEVAATAWTQLLGCPHYDGQATLDAIQDFRDAYVGNGPEQIPLEL